MKQRLTTPDPLSSEGCSRDSCPVHSTGGKGDCKRPGVLYGHVYIWWWEGGERLARQGLLEENSIRIKFRQQEKVRARQTWTVA